jgi:hypothetical protein
MTEEKKNVGRRGIMDEKEECRERGEYERLKERM